jgi:hypothetical protein
MYRFCGLWRCSDSDVGAGFGQWLSVRGHYVRIKCSYGTGLSLRSFDMESTGKRKDGGTWGTACFYLARFERVAGPQGLAFIHQIRQGFEGHGRTSRSRMAVPADRFGAP